MLQGLLHSKPRLIATAFLMVAIYAVLYPRRVELAGDQNAAVIAAQSLLQSGTYTVPLHESYGTVTPVEIGADLRQTLKWYPPGYTLGIYLLARLGLSIGAAGLAVFYAVKFAWTVGWLAAGAAYRIPPGIVLISVAFSLVLTYPSSTTDIFESTGIALLFLALSQQVREPGSAILASTGVTGATLFRFAAIKLAGFYALVELLRRPRISTAVKAGLAMGPAMAAYVACTRFLGGELSPYHGVGPAPHTNWFLLAKGAYYATLGGWSPAWGLLRPLAALLAIAGGVGLLRLHREGCLPNWILLAAGLQAYFLFFLIYIQAAYGSMYAPEQPAFTTPRFFALTQPFNVMALLFLAPFALPSPRLALRTAAALLVLATAISWTFRNRELTASMTEGPDGFVRWSDVDAAHRMLRAERVDAVFDGTGVLMYTAVDARAIYPDNIRSVHSGKPARIAVVRFKSQPNELLDGLEKRMAPCAVKRFDRFEVDLFALPAGFSIAVNSHHGYVPRV